MDDYPDEKDKHLAKLKKQADAAVRKFNESSADASTTATSSAAETCGSAIPQPKSLPSKPRAPKPQEKPAQTSVTKPSAPKSSAPPQVSKPELKSVMKSLPATSSSSLLAATSSETKSSPPPVKTQVSAERGTQPSPCKIITVPSASEGSDEYDDETLQSIIRNKQERVAQASGSTIPLAMDPKVLLDYINIWYEDPHTPLDDLKLPPGISHMVATFINEAKWKEQQAKQAKDELKTLIDKYSKLSDRQSLKSSFIKYATKAVDDYNKKPADESPQADETPQAEEIPQESRVDVPGIEEITTENPADESSTAGETAPVPAGSSKPADESVERSPSPKASKVKKMTPSASDVKKTMAAEKEAKKRKVSSAEENTEAKRLKALEENAPLDPVTLNITPSYEMVTFEDQEKGPDEEMKDAASEEHTDKEILEEQADQTPPPEQDLHTKAQNEPIPSPEQNPQHDAPVDEIPQPDAHPDSIPQHEAQHEQAPQPEAQADEIPHPEDNAEENAPDQDNAFVVLNPETAIVVSPPAP
ncbi:hypothetical protein ZWY2020_004142 [Hordeum vulgare]|nr:hypothetical protein ZWY2020_004142 [Hordeum vulgare]